MKSGETNHAVAILDSFRFKKLKSMKTEEPLEGDGVKIVDLSDMPLLALQKKWSFPLGIFSVNVTKSFTEEIYNGKFHFLCSVEDSETQIVDLLHMPPLEDDEEVKSVPEETISKRVKLNTWEKLRRLLKILTPNKLLARLSILLIKAGISSYKLKNKLRQILHGLYQHNKFTTKSLLQINQVIIVM